MKARRASCALTLGLAFLVVCVAGCGSSRQPARPVPTVVPWVDQPLPLYRPPRPKTIPYPTSAPLCRASQLRVTQGRGGGALGTWYQRVVFTNVSETTCLLRGYPTISAIEPDGVRRPLRPRTHDAGPDSLVPADIPPGRHALLELESSDRCSPATHWRRPVFTLPGVGAVSADDRFGLLVFCGISWSSVGLPQRYVLVTDATPGTAGSLRAVLSAPPSVRLGTTLRYTVTLVDPTVVPVVLRPCPSYTETLTVTLPIVQRTFRLNCSRSIPARGRVRFAMRFHVSPRERPVLADIVWTLDTPTGPGVSSRVRLTP